MPMLVCVDDSFDRSASFTPRHTPLVPTEVIKDPDEEKDLVAGQDRVVRQRRTPLTGDPLWPAIRHSQVDSGVVARDRYCTVGYGLDGLRPASGQKHLPNATHQQFDLRPCGNRQGSRMHGAVRHRAGDLGVCRPADEVDCRNHGAGDR